MKSRFATAMILLAAAAAGCQRTEELQFVSGTDVAGLSEKLQSAVRQELQAHSGTPLDPRWIDEHGPSATRLRRGALVYQERCAACHGTTGDGAGLAAANMYPRPRDYRRGVFKFISTYNPAGNSKPLRSDLLRTIRQGAKGTAMPSFNLLPDEDLEAVVDYVLALTHRGELESKLVDEASEDDAIDPKKTKELIADIMKKWKSAEGQVVLPMSKPIAYSDASVAKGREMFFTECYKCHGKDGRGQPADNKDEFKDIWGFQTRAADLTSGMFHGGNRPLDIYRRVYAGITGTPMPSFAIKLAKDPEMYWHLVHYVQFVSNARRADVVAAHPNIARDNPNAPEIQD